MDLERKSELSRAYPERELEMFSDHYSRVSWKINPANDSEKERGLRPLTPVKRLSRFGEDTESEEEAKGMTHKEYQELKDK